MTDAILVDVVDGVATVTMNRPEARNALNAELRLGIPAILGELDARDDVRAMLLTGADPAFCAGLDLKELAHTGMGSDRPAIPPAADGTRLPFAHLTKPLIGAVNGATVTGGLEFALGCDFLIASERAAFADTHARVNVMPGWGLSVFLPQAIGIRRARQMSFTGNYVDAATALSWGLVNQVVPHNELLPTAQKLAADAATIRAESLAAIKQVYNQTQGDAGTTAGLITEIGLSRDWQKNFDPNQLAEEREAIQARGSNQAT